MSAYTPLGVVFANNASQAEALAAFTAYQEGRNSVTSNVSTPTVPAEANGAYIMMLIQNFVNGQSDQRVENAIIQAQAQAGK